jgi:hypothetical protein
MSGYLMVLVPIVVFCVIGAVFAGFAFRLPRSLAALSKADRLFARARGLAATAFLWCVMESVFAAAFVVYVQQASSELETAALVALAIPVLIVTLPFAVKRSMFLGACITSMVLLTGYAVLAMWGTGPALLPAVLILLAAAIVESRGVHASTHPVAGYSAGRGAM